MNTVKTTRAQDLKEGDVIVVFGVKATVKFVSPNFLHNPHRTFVGTDKGSTDFANDDTLAVVTGV